MGEAGRHLDLAQKSFRSDLGRYVGAKNLYRNCAVMAEIARKKHDSHATFTKVALDSIAATKTGLEALLQVVHESQYWCQ